NLGGLVLADFDGVCLGIFGFREAEARVGLEDVPAAPLLKLNLEWKQSRREISTGTSASCIIEGYHDNEYSTFADIVYMEHNTVVQDRDPKLLTRAVEEAYTEDDSGDEGRFGQLS
ncbi:hypothetical protein Tco_1261892, partial [Tanacetum coccineum]